MDINYHKRKVIDLGDFINKNDLQVQEPYLIDNLQLYNPILESKDRTNKNSIATEYNKCTTRAIQQPTICNNENL